VLPEAVVRVRAILDDDSKGAQDIARVIQSDSTLSMTVLRLANSARFAPAGKEVCSLSAAIQRLGGRRTLHLLIAISGKVHMSIRHPLLQSIHRESVEYSLRVAAVAQILAGVLRAADPGEAFLAGLLHDVGISAIVCAVPEELSACEPDELRHCVEMLHREMGGRLLLHWGMPACFSQVAVHHGIESDDRPHEQLIDFVDAAASLLSAGNIAADPDAARHVPAFGRLGVTATHLAAVEVEMEDGVSEVQQLFGATA